MKRRAQRPADVPPMQPEESIFFRLAKANQQAGRFWKKQLAPLNLTPVQGLVLCFLHREDGLSPAALGKRVQLDSATLTGVITRLEKSGLAMRRKDREDRRSVRVRLTAEGQRLSRRVSDLLAAAHHAYMAAFSPEETAQLLTLLKKVET